MLTVACNILGNLQLAAHKGIEKEVQERYIISLCGFMKWHIDNPCLTALISFILLCSLTALSFSATTLPILLFFKSSYFEIKFWR